MEKQTSDILERIITTVNTAGDLAQHGLDSASKKAGDVWNCTKLRWKQADLNADVQQLYREVGRIVHSAHLDAKAPTDRLEQLLEQLDAKMEAMAAIEKEFKSRKGERPCPNEICKGTIAADDLFCRHCGTALHSEESTTL